MNDTAPLSVGPADEQDVTYYGLPSVKPSLWGGLVSGYMFVAGIGGSAQITATAADLVGDRALAPIIRNGRYIALGATVLGGPPLIIDLHTPQRWYNMLRIFRKTSPMSIGTWVLISFGSLSAASLPRNSPIAVTPPAGPSRGRSSYCKFPRSRTWRNRNAPAIRRGAAAQSGVLVADNSAPV